MATYLVVKVIHRLDGIVVVKAISTGNQRSVVFRVKKFLGTAILPGRTYSVRREHGQVFFTLAPMSPEHWSRLVKNSFYISEIQIPRGEQNRLLLLTTQGIASALLALEQRDHEALTAYVSEPYASTLSFYFLRQTRLMEAIYSLIGAGFSHHEAMNVCLIYSPEEAHTLLDTPAKTFPFLGAGHMQRGDSNAHKLANSPAYRLIAWMLTQVRRGATLLPASDVPTELRSALPYCLDNRLLVADDEHYQLIGHHLIQSSIRSQLQTLTHHFFPTYADREIEHAYVRYSSLFGALNDSDYCHLVGDAINSRFSIFTHSSNDTAAAFCDEFSSILQILGGSEPSVVHQGLAGKYGSEVRVVHWEAISEVPGEYRTFVVWDFQWYSAVEVSLLLAHFTPRDRVVFLRNQATAIDGSLNGHIVGQLQDYFPSHSIEPHRGAIPGPPSAHSSLDRAIAELQADPNLVAICDSYQLCEVIDNLVRKRSQPTALETQWDTYSKGDRLLFKQAYPKTVKYARLVSTDDRGLVVESQGRYWRIDTETVRNSVCTLGAAMTIEDALHAGVSRAVLVTDMATMSGLAQVMKERGIDLIGAFAYDMTKADIPQVNISLQRITPSVE